MPKNAHCPEQAPRVWRRSVSPLLVLLLVAVLASIFALSRPLAATAAQAADEQAEIEYQPDYLHLATGDAGAEHSTYAWPFALESLGHAIESYQYYGGSPYFHHGLDIMTPSGTDVLNRSGGQIVNVENYQPGNDLYWEVAVLDPEGYLWQYHHIDRYTIPQAIWDKYNEYLADPVNGGFVPPDTYIGDVVWWPVGYPGAPSNFHHIHLNILGEGGVYINGLEFHTSLADAASPEILQIGLLKNGQIYPGNQVEGEYGLYVHARDLVLAPAWYWLPPYEVKFSVDAGPATVVWRFDTLPGGSNRYSYATDYYVVPPTCGDYGCNEFYVDLGFTTQGQRAFPAAPGQHKILVKVRDYAGNTDLASFSWIVLAPGSSHIGDLDGSSRYHPNGNWRAVVAVTVEDQYHGRLAGATVTGYWGGGVGGTGTCTTAVNGRCTVLKTNIGAALPSVTFTVDSVTKAGYPYAPGDNHDPDGDSDGTVIAVARP